MRFFSNLRRAIPRCLFDFPLYSTSTWSYSLPSLNCSLPRSPMFSTSPYAWTSLGCISKKVTPLQRKYAWFSSLALLLHLVKRFVIPHWRGQWRQQSASLGMLPLISKQNIKRFDSHRLSQLTPFRLEFSLCGKSVVWEVKSQYSQPAAPRRQCPLYEWGLGGKRAPALSVVPAMSSFLQYCYRGQSYWYPDTPRMKMQP